MDDLYYKCIRNQYLNFFKSKGLNDVYITKHFMDKIYTRKATLYQLKPLLEKIINLEEKKEQDVRLAHNSIRIKYDNGVLVLKTFVDKRFRTD